MSKGRRSYTCDSCGYVSASWFGRCPECGAWDSFIERSGEAAEDSSSVPAADVASIDSIDMSRVPRIESGIAEFDRVLGGGIVPGGYVLVGGVPGIGKSTLLLHVAARVADIGPVLLATGEETAAQVRVRGERIGTLHKELFVSAETDCAAIIARAQEMRPALLIVDSIQSITLAGHPGTAGSPAQVRACASALARLAKHEDIPVIVVGHVTKEGVIAGPKALEHMVDTVLYFEGDGQHLYRLVRAVKNRYGSTDEVGVFEMTATGLTEVEHPSLYFVGDGDGSAGNGAIVPAMEGTRVLLAEVQALATRTGFPNPRRLSLGFDPNRLLFLLAVLEKHGGCSALEKDVYVNVTGGLRMREPASDLAVALALATALEDRTPSAPVVAFGEVGLDGRIRGVPFPDARLREAAKLNAGTAVIPPYDRIPVNSGNGMTIRSVRTLREALEVAFGIGG